MCALASEAIAERWPRRPPRSSARRGASIAADDRAAPSCYRSQRRGLRRPFRRRLQARLLIRLEVADTNEHDTDFLDEALSVPYLAGQRDVGMGLGQTELVER